jgi:hypothetical protein
MDHTKDSADQHYSQLEVVSHSQPKAEQPASPRIVHEPRVVRSYWRRKWVWFVIVGVIVIGAIVGGVVGGVVVRRSQGGGQTVPMLTASVALERQFSLQLNTVLITR